ncbi:Cytosolic sulfotransferase 5 [Linum grandiflorum]
MMSSNSAQVPDKEACWDMELSEVEGFWYSTGLLPSVQAFRKNFNPKRDDVVILASNPKTGTTWLKALSYCILFRDGEDGKEDLLTKMNPHLCVPSLEAGVYLDDDPSSRLDSGRLFNTHMPYSHLPDSAKKHCKLVYITREPKNMLVSQWHFFNKVYRGNNLGPLPLERAAEIFCSGRIPVGPYWEHVLEYCEASQTSPDKVMFIKYEDLRRDPKLYVRKLASFLGKPFGDDDEEEVEKVIWRSSFDRLKDLDVNKNGKSYPEVAPLLTNNLFFRRGEVGDWRNHLTAEMAKRIDDITREKFRCTGLYLSEESVEHTVNKISAPEIIMSSTKEETGWGVELTQVEGFWYGNVILDSINAFRENFKPKREDDVVILASNPKTGTTWLKALSYCILFRDDQEEEDILTKMNPHLCVPFLEGGVYLDVDPSSRVDPGQDRLFNTHMPYSYLPESVKQNCKLVYITRDPKDTLVSQWHFFNKAHRANQEPLKIETAAEIFCSGPMSYGPYWEHVLEYWEASQRSPDKVMFLKYEDLRHDPKVQVRKLAFFLGKPFGDDDDEEVEKVIWRSSFDRLKNLEINKTGKSYPVLAPELMNNFFFRRGEVGDWRNHMTVEIAKRIDDITRDKFRCCGLYLNEEEKAV